jgi:YVTN family beta-propeller protein
MRAARLLSLLRPVARSLPRRGVAALLLATSACGPSPNRAGLPGAGAADDAHARLPTGARLDPAAPLQAIGPMPLTMVSAPEADRVVVLLNGFRDEGIQVLDRATGRVLQTVHLPAAFLGLAFTPDGRSLYVSGGNTGVVYRFDWNGRATLRDSIILEPRGGPRSAGHRYPSGLALSDDGGTLYVAENLVDSLAVVDVGSGRVRQRVATGRSPYGVVATATGQVYVSNWGGETVSSYGPAEGGLRPTGEIRVGRHPSALLLNPRGNRLFVASASTDRVLSVDLARRRVIGQLLDRLPDGPSEGATPNALALSARGDRLFVAEADANAIAVFDLADGTAGIVGSGGDDRLAGRIPTGWYPTAVLARGDTLLVACAKGSGTAANPDGPGPRASADRRQAAGTNSTLAQLTGALMIAPLARADAATLARTSGRVAQANGWTEPPGTARWYPPIEHVIYIVKENRTYDQVLGDLRPGDGDSSLVYFGRDVSPNHHALAERFGTFDRFFTNAEVSADGHNWSTAAYVTDYLEKTVQLNYSGRGRTYDYEGASLGARTRIDSDDINAPAQGYLWDLAERKGITYRNYGEFVVPDSVDPDDVLPHGYRGNRPGLAAHTNPLYPGFDLAIPDQRRADLWIEELAAFAQRGTMPALEIVRLPNDHTAGASALRPTPRAYMADNDLALGRIIEALSRSRFWATAAVFVVEDDAQNGPDHVDSHRAPFLVISPYARAGVVHRFINTTDVLRTIEELLGLSALSQFDYYGRPLRDIWRDTPDLRPVPALLPAVSLQERNPSATRGARESIGLELRTEDAADEALFNRILWRAAKGDRPYPGTRRAPAAALLR